MGGINGFSQYWQERTTDEVKKAINQLIGNSFSVDKFKKENEKLASEIEDLQTQVELLVSATTTKESNHPLSDIEKIEPKKKLKSYLRAYMSGSMMTRDSEAVAQGIFTPAIVYYEGVVYDAAKFLTMAIDMFRNEKSHTSNAEIDDSQQAEEYLTLSSLAMHLLDRAEILTI